MQEWAGFFTAELGASAALAGLVIVAISINIARILADPTLPGRAAETLVAPTGVLVASSLALVPGQPALGLGIEILCTGAVMGILPVLLIASAARGGKVHAFYLAARAVLASLAFLPFVVAGTLLVTGMADIRLAFYWMVPGVIVSLVATVLNAWVLLVEILR
jgi:hypothetical protein